MKRRIARDRRRPGVHVVLGDRDAALLRGLARLRLAATDDLVRLYFSGVRRDTAAARLRRLHDGGFIEATVDALQAQNLYSVGPEGRAWAEEQDLVVRPRPRGSCTHHLALVRAWTGLAATVRTYPHLRLLRFEPDWELRTRLAGQSPATIPDAAVELSVGSEGMVLRVALEIDCSTERPGALRQKLAMYTVSSHFTDAANVTLAVLLVGAGPRRQDRVRELVDRFWNGPRLVQSESDWPHLLLHQLAPPPLTASPHGKGRTVDVTPSGETPTASQGEEPSR